MSISRCCISILLPVMMMLVSGCASVSRTAYTQSDASAARALDVAGVRRYADEPASSFRDETSGVKVTGSSTYLALSGGGADGAFGAGVLNGWTESGSRPEFSVVSGVSTGAIIAPFAFLGPSYDATLREVYTSGVASSLLESPNILNFLVGSGLFGNERLRELVSRYIDRDMVTKIAGEWAKGRHLYIVTTNLDSQRSVIWNMGRIASLGTPKSLTLFWDVVAASASIPAVFPPMLIDVSSSGRRFQELHIDGGVMMPVLTLPDSFLLRDERLAAASRAKLYILVNNKIDNDFQVVPNKTIEIAARSSSTVTKTATRSIIYNTYDAARRNNFEFNLTYIEGRVPSSSSAGFDTEYMRSLFAYGYERARSGSVWSKAPPVGAFVAEAGRGEDRYATPRLAGLKANR